VTTGEEAKKNLKIFSLLFQKHFLGIDFWETAGDALTM
jgi:hypothetical protein